MRSFVCSRLTDWSETRAASQGDTWMIALAPGGGQAIRFAAAARGGGAGGMR